MADEIPAHGVGESAYAGASRAMAPASGQGMLLYMAMSGRDDLPGYTRAHGGAGHPHGTYGIASAAARRQPGRYAGQPDVSNFADPSVYKSKAQGMPVCHSIDSMLYQGFNWNQGLPWYTQNMQLQGGRAQSAPNSAHKPSQVAMVLLGLFEQVSATASGGQKAEPGKQ